jgi:hypothetical protein
VIQNSLTKEEIKLIKGGRAYRNWRKWVFLGSAAFFAWAFFGMPLAHMNNITGVIYTIGLIIAGGVVFYFLVLTCWKCPQCHAKLPKKSMINSGYLPFLIKNCPCCGEDLTKV